MHKDECHGMLHEVHERTITFNWAYTRTIDVNLYLGLQIYEHSKFCNYKTL